MLTLQFYFVNHLLQVASLRGSISSFQEQASCKPLISSVSAPYRLCQSFNLKMYPSGPRKVSFGLESGIFFPLSQVSIHDETLVKSCMICWQHHAAFPLVQIFNISSK